MPAIIKRHSPKLLASDSPETSLKKISGEFNNIINTINRLEIQTNYREEQVITVAQGEIPQTGQSGGMTAGKRGKASVGSAEILKSYLYKHEFTNASFPTEALPAGTTVAMGFTILPNNYVLKNIYIVVETVFDDARIKITDTDGNLVNYLEADLENETVYHFPIMKKYSSAEILNVVFYATAAVGAGAGRILFEVDEIKTV